jgi:hypothetical protein
MPIPDHARLALKALNESQGYVDTSQCLPQSTRRLEIAVRVSLPTRAPLVWFARLSKQPSGLMPHGFGIPAPWFAIHLAGFAPEAPGSIEPLVASADLDATSEYDPSPFAPAILEARALSRGFSPPQRNPSVEVYHSRVLPARVTLRPCTYHVLRRVTPSPDSLGSFHPGALSGRHPSELHQSEITSSLDGVSPLAISFPTAAQTLGLLLAQPLPRNWLS